MMTSERKLGLELPLTEAARMKRNKVVIAEAEYKELLTLVAAMRRLRMSKIQVDRFYKRASKLRKDLPRWRYEEEYFRRAVESCKGIPKLESDWLDAENSLKHGSDPQTKDGIRIPRIFSKAERSKLAKRSAVAFSASLPQESKPEIHQFQTEQEAQMFVLQYIANLIELAGQLKEERQNAPNKYAIGKRLGSIHGDLLTLGMPEENLKSLNAFVYQNQFEVKARRKYDMTR
jgi:hypothetical protein